MDRRPKAEVLRRLEDAGIVPVIKLKNTDDAEALAEALHRGGILTAEVTFRAEGAETVIRRMRGAYPDMIVGAGTVITIEQAERAASAGAEFLVSPGLDEEIIRFAEEQKLAVIPGCVTPTELQQALRLGLKLVKYFPAEPFGGIRMLKALSAPFPGVKFMPTGGIDTDNLEAYLSLPCTAACGGSYMVGTGLLEQKKWDQVTELCRCSSEIVRRVRQRG